MARISGIGGKIELINRSTSAQQINGSLNNENLEPVDGKVVNIVDISEIQHQIDALVTKTNELFSLTSNIDTNLQKEVNKRILDIESLLTKLNSEANIRQETDEEIYSQLLAKINKVAADISSFLSKLSLETSERKSADNSLRQNITAVSIDLNTKLSAEAKARADEDNRLSQSISKEVTDRQDADTAIYAYIDNETQELVNIIAALDAAIRKILDKKVDKVSGKGLSTNDFTNRLKNKLENIEAEAQVNIIESISVNDIKQRVEDKNVDIKVPTKVSELSNDTGYALQSDLVDNYATRVWVEDKNYISSVSWNDVKDKPAFETVATTGDYDDLINKPVIPAAQVNSDWNASSGIAQILNKPTLAKVATTGKYSDLKNKPSLGSAAYMNVGTSAGNVVVLDGTGKISTNLLPPAAITEIYEASSEAEMLALPATRGSICVRSDLNRSFILSDIPASTLSNWRELQTPQDTVLSVNGKIGVVTLTAQDVEALPSNTEYVQSVKSLDTTLTYAQTPEASESLAGNGIITLHKISKTGDYNDLLNKPIIPAAQIQADWAQTNTSAKDYIKNKPVIPTVSVVDVLVNGRSVIDPNDKKAKIRVPLTTSDLVNDSDFVSKTWVQTQNYLAKADIDAKQDKLTFNSHIPEGTEAIPLSTIQDADTYYAVDAVTSETRAGEIVDFIFENSSEITYTSIIDTNCILTIPSTIKAGFISLLTILNMSANKTITIQKEDEEIPFNIRIISGNTALPGDTYTTSISGKKIIFVRCDGADIEILFIEELEA